MNQKVLFKCYYGSKLYGTNNANSDTDYKLIHMNATDVILTGKYKGTVSESTNADKINNENDVDIESKELRTFINDALSGVTYAIELLFVPDNMIISRSPEYNFIRSNRDKIINRNIKPFIGYVRSQASNYSRKGEKLKELEYVIGTLRDKVKKSSTTLKECLDYIDFTELNHFSIKDKKLNGENASSEQYMFGPGFEFPTNRKLVDVISVLKNKRFTFGKRTEASAKNGNLDLKAYYHALRIVWQLEEYLTQRVISFPSRNLDVLIGIRNGVYSKSYIEDLIDSEIERVLQIENTLPEANRDFWDEWLMDQYMMQAYLESQRYLKAKNKI